MIMNMQNLMMQAKKMQKDLEKAQSELESKMYEGKSQIVTVRMTGDGKVSSISIDEDLSSVDKDMLEDMIVVAINEAVSNIDKEKQEKFGKYGQMFNGLM